MALFMNGSFRHFQGRDEAARPLLEESVARFRQVGDSWGLAGPLMYLSEIHAQQKRFVEARTLAEEGLRLVRQTGDTWRISANLDGLGEVILAEGDYLKARGLFQESLALCREMNNRRRIAYELRNLGHVARFEQDFTSARAYYVESLTHYRDLDAKPGIANLLDAFARLATAQNRMERAARLFGAADALRVSINASVPPLERKDHEEGVVAARDALGERHSRQPGQRDRRWHSNRPSPTRWTIRRGVEMPAVLPGVVRGVENPRSERRLSSEVSRSDTDLPDRREVPYGTSRGDVRQDAHRAARVFNPSRYTMERKNERC
jgi:tetratricopeptide (TPR) repeat protein